MLNLVFKMLIMGRRFYHKDNEYIKVHLDGVQDEEKDSSKTYHPNAIRVMDGVLVMFKPNQQVGYLHLFSFLTSTMEKRLR